MANGTINIKLGLTIKSRDNSARWRETHTATEAFSYITNKDTYVACIDSNLPTLDTMISVWRSQPATEVSCHYSVTLENVTAPDPPTGAWVQAKQHLDGKIGDEEFTTSLLREKLLFTIEQLLKLAKY